MLAYQFFIIGKNFQEGEDVGPVIPVLFYHGKEPWKGQKSFQEGFWGEFFAKTPVSMQKNMLNYELKLLDTHNPKVERVLKDKSFKSRGFLNVLKGVWLLKAEEDVLKEAVSLFDNWPGDKNDLLLSLGDYLWATVPGMTEELWKKVENEACKKGIFSKGGYMNIREYIKEEGRQEGIQKGRQEGIQKGIQKGIQEGIQKGRQEGIQKGIQKGIQEGIQKGRQEGIQKGIQKGIQEGRQQVVLNMLQKKLDASLISEVTGLSEEEIKNLKNGSE